MVHLYELIKIDREHLKGNHEMLSKIELIHPTDNVFLVLGVLVI